MSVFLSSLLLYVILMFSFLVDRNWDWTNVFFGCIFSFNIVFYFQIGFITVAVIFWGNSCTHNGFRVSSQFGYNYAIYLLRIYVFLLCVYLLTISFQLLLAFLSFFGFMELLNPVSTYGIFLTLWSCGAALF